jgi:hypothetical protein
MYQVYQIVEIDMDEIDIDEIDMDEIEDEEHLVGSLEVRWCDETERYVMELCQVHIEV